eukprot:CAMPEP_0175142714 /NCGR_PEP_ID=MMETSP0087-20121206/12978_1 /TAXON_ID=136419 /ORGANISM="Unknown Unknown, Strain D1" /LENGTH=80 /DNA_ID=CAMNT_0016426599 /DNA_START=81 /DNA_END=323 /DNA_ORIENTATION=+
MSIQNGVLGPVVAQTFDHIEPASDPTRDDDFMLQDSINLNVRANQLRNVESDSNGRTNEDNNRDFNNILASPRSPPSYND